MTRARAARRPAGVWAAAAMALAGVLGLAPAASAEEALTVVRTDVTAYPDVSMVVAAPPELGDQPLSTAAFKVVEGGEVRTVTVEPLPADQLELALVIDTSASMAGAPLTAAKVAAQSFLAQVPAGVPVSIIAFGASPTIVSPRSANRPAQVAAIKGLSARGDTALYDALGLALAELPGSGARRMAVLLTDGGDTRSTATLNATADALVSAKVPLFAVELTTSESNPAALGRLTSVSGGRLVPASDPTALAGAFDAVARQLVRQYAVSYRSQANGSTDIDVIVEAEGVRATSRPHLELPAAPVAEPAAPSPSTAVTARAPSSSGVGTWALVLGGVCFGAGLLGLSLGYVHSRTPKARGLARKRTVGLTDLADRAEAMGDSVLRRHGGVARVSEALEVAGLDVRAGELVSGLVAVAVVALGAGWALFSPIVGLAASLTVPLLARVVLGSLASRRRKRFCDQMAETLQILAGSLRAGHGLARGIETVAHEAESPTAEEFRRLTVEIRLGRDFVEAMSALADRAGSEDFQWVVQAVEIQREVGGDLAEILDTAAGTIRDRTRIRRQVSALSAEGRMSAWVLMILPFGLAAVMAVTNPKYLSPLFQTGTGLGLLAVAGALLAVGGLWLRHIVKPTF